MVSSHDGWAVGYNSVSGFGAILHGDGAAWTEVPASAGVQYPVLSSVFVASATDGWAVGAAGRILHWDGMAWSTLASPTAIPLNSGTMLSPTNGWAVGGSTSDPGIILHWDGSTWSQVAGAMPYVLSSVAC